MVWHRALFSRFVSVLILCVTAKIGDNLVAANSFNRLHKALCDNLTHGAISAVTWATVGYFAGLPRWQELNVVLCTVLAMIIDLDHFAAARSFRVEDATSLSHRPPLHCSSIPIVTSVCGLLAAVTTRSPFVARSTCIVGAAFFSHHFRDAARRGLWVWPFGSTPPFPEWVYFSSLAIVPHVLAFIVANFEGRPKLRNVYLPVHAV